MPDPREPPPQRQPETRADHLARIEGVLTFLCDMVLAGRRAQVAALDPVRPDVTAIDAVDGHIVSLLDHFADPGDQLAQAYRAQVRELAKASLDKRGRQVSRQLAFLLAEDLPPPGNEPGN
jgi:hypothetical protein